MQSFNIDGTDIGAAHPPYMIAEMSGNHNGDIERAKALIDAAKASGAHAVKMQTYTADTITMKCDRPEFIVGKGLWEGRTLYDLYEEAHTPWAWHPALFEHAKNVGLTIFSSPFDSTAVDMLDDLGAPAYKIASFEIIDLPLVKYVARLGKPMIVSTGMASIGEIGEAVAAIRETSDAPVALLHCTSGYPTPPDECRLRTIQHLSETFGVTAGLSDHTLGVAVPIAAVAGGATIIEKHFTLSRADGGVDSGFSLEPAEFKQMTEAAETAWRALGGVDYTLQPSESSGRDSRRSLYVTSNVKVGDVLTAETIRSIRPGLGLAPKYLPDVLGKRAARDIKRGEPLSWTMIAE